MTILQDHLQEFRRGRDLPGLETETFLDSLINETDESILIDVFLAWDRKGISADEIFELASVMRKRCTRVVSAHERFVDIVGTGGSRNKTFNVSTAAAFVVAGAGVPVAKHGNKAATSSTGSADVLSALGVEPAVDAATAERCLNEIGICFMYAPNFHRLSATLGKVRRGLGFPTIFNCVGPLCNPANAPHQLIGVWNKELVSTTAKALARLGTTKSWVVHGSDGLDEISLGGPTLVAEVEDGAVSTFEISPEDLGFKPRGLEEFRVTSADASAELIRGVLEGTQRGTAAEDIILLNAAAAFFLSGRAEDLIEGYLFGADSIKNARAMNKLNLLAAATKV